MIYEGKISVWTWTRDDDMHVNAGKAEDAGGRRVRNERR
jgi:hypothetical protein